MLQIRKTSLWLLACCAIASGSSWAIDLSSFKNPFSASPVVGRMGNVEMTLKQLQDLIKMQSSETRQNLLNNPDALKEAVRAELLRRALLDEARKVEWDKRPEIAMAIERSSEQITIESFVVARSEPEANFPSNKELEAAYQTNLSQFAIPEQIHLAQILIRLSEHPTADENNRAAAQMREVTARLKEGVDFGVLAGMYSQDEGSKAKRGELDWIAENELMPQIRDELKLIKTGWVSKPLRTLYGWQIFKVLERRPATVRPLAEVREPLIKALRTLRTNENRSRFLDGILRANPATLDEAALKEVNTTPQ